MYGFHVCVPGIQRCVLGYVVPGVLKKCNFTIFEGHTILSRFPETALSLKIKA